MTALAPYRWAIVGYALVAAVFVGYQRTMVLRVLDSRDVLASYWDVPLTAAGSGFLFTFLLAPVAILSGLTQVRPRATWENIARYPTRTDWVIAQLRFALPWIGALVGATAMVTLAGGLGLPGARGWGEAGDSAAVASQLPALAPLLPHPALTFALQLVATAAALALVALILAAAASSLAHPRAAEVAGGVLLAWTLISFPLGTGMVGVPALVVLLLTPSLYASASLAVETLGLGPAGGLAVLLVVVPLVVLSVRALEVRRARAGAGTGALRGSRVLLAGGPVLLLAGLGILSIPPLSLMGEPVSPALATIALLQGSGETSGALTSMTGMMLLAAFPALAVHRGFVTALGERRFVEMIRLGSPGKWLRRHLETALDVTAAYAAWCGVVTVLLVAAWVGLDGAALRLVAVWTIALALQTLVLVLSLVLGTALARSPTGGAVALGVAIVLSWPLGRAATYSPFGQASLLRLATPEAPGAAPHLTPLVVLTLWALVLAVATSVLFSRTRGEIE